MKEIISLHIGQAGIQIGNACWELYCLEHGIQPDGKTPTTGYNIKGEHNKALNSFFTQTDTNKYTPKSLFIDTEPTVIDQLRTGVFRELFDPEQMISGKEDAANNYARGYYCVGRAMIDYCMDKIRKLAEDCASLQGFIISSSVGGGTGSGLGSLLLEKLTKEYPKPSKLNFVVYPSPQYSICVEPYNAVLATHGLLEHTDMSIMLDNEAIYGICKKNLNLEKPSYNDLNKLIAQVSSSVTASLRFESALNSDIKELQTNLVPYPRIHFMSASYAPIISVEKVSHKLLTVADLTNSVFDPSSITIKCDTKSHRYIACSLVYRGDVTPKEVNSALVNIKKQKKTIRFTDWCITGFKAGIINQPPAFVPNGILAEAPRTTCMISNSSVMAEAFSRIVKKFYSLYRKRGFVHWYAKEGMEEGEFNEAREELASVAKDYEDISPDHHWCSFGGHEYEYEYEGEE